MTNNIVYALIDDYKLWLEESTRQTESDKRAEFSFPAKITILPDHVFRVNKPAVVGVRVLAGRIRVGENLINLEGKDCGTIKSVRDDDGNILKEGVQGDEVSVAIDGVTVGRQINENDVLYVDLIESGYKAISKLDLTDDEKLAMSDTVAIKRKSEPFWGM
jgi:translation initiation factor 5B